LKTNRFLAGLGLALLCALFAARCGSNGGCPSPTSPCPPTTTTTTTTPPPPPPPQIFVGAGDIGSCGRDANPAATARLLDGFMDGTVFTAGDNAYLHGSAQDFRNCYDPTWGRHRERTYPSPGNHEYESPNAGPYFDYFGDMAGQRPLGYYSYELGTWHILSLNSNIPTEIGSPQYAFVTRDLSTNRAACTLAYWHHPLFTSGVNGPNRHMADIFRALYDAGADVVINGHDHLYERFAPQNADGVVDSARGIRQFIIGTGGAELTDVRSTASNSEVRIARVYGVLKMTLGSGSYDATFIQANGTVNGVIGDFVSGRCH
jgi:hypothetical protein